MIETIKILIIYVLCIIIRFVNQTKLHLVIYTMFCFLRCFPPIKFLLLFWRNASFSIIHVIYFKRKYNFVKVDQWNRMDVLVTCFELIMWCVRKHFRLTLTSYLFSLQRLVDDLYIMGEILCIKYLWWKYKCNSLFRKLILLCKMRKTYFLRISLILIF